MSAAAEVWSTWRMPDQAGSPVGPVITAEVALGVAAASAARAQSDSREPSSLTPPMLSIRSSTRMSPCSATTRRRRSLGRTSMI